MTVSKRGAAGGFPGRAGDRARPPRSPASSLRRLAALAAVSLLVTFGSLPAVGAAGAVGRAAHVTGSSAFDWPEFHLGGQHQGYAANSSISTATAPSLGVAWATNLYGPALDSPAIAFDATLNETLAYIGTESGDVVAVNVANGAIVWALWLGSPIRTSPAVSAGSVYVGTFDSPTIYRLDATTGAIDCSVASSQPIESSPVVATPPGGVATVYFGTNDSQASSGPLLAINAATCAVEWSFTGYVISAGAWDPIAYTLDASGEPLVIFGTADPDSQVYALDAVTGAEVWHYAAANPPPGAYDVGAGATISPPGTNGFADGVVYVPTKYGVMYALDLSTGSFIWSYDFNQVAGVTDGGRSTAALDGVNLVFGYNGGLFDLDAITGTLLWRYSDPTSSEALSSPAIAGPAGAEVVAVGDLGGSVDVVSLATGAQLYQHQTGGYITASPAVSGGNIVIASSDGFLYDFAPGGGNESATPTTTVTTPAEGATIANPHGSYRIKGTATDGAGVKAIDIAIEASGAGGPWWDAATSTWTSGPAQDHAVLASPGATSTTWSFSFPAPPGGGNYEVTANAISATGDADITGARRSFVISATKTGARVTLSSAFVPPGWPATVAGAGFAPSEQVSVSLLGKVLASTTTSGTGTFTGLKVKIPSSTPFGPTSLIVAGATSGDSVAAVVTVANSWDESGYSAGHSSYEPNDSALENLVHPGANIFVDPAWEYQTGASVATAPAIVDDVAYLGDSSGQVVALDVHNGGVRWTFQLPSGSSPISGSPAVDIARKLVFVGADDGTIDAISTTTGTLKWTATLGGDVAPPIFSGGEVDATSSDGTVAVLAETTGALKWSESLAGGTPTAPSLDATTGDLVVGASGGSVVDFDAATGTTRWTYGAGGAVTAAPVAADGIVYVGSANDRVVALSQSTGAVDWQFETAAPVGDTGSLGPSLSSGNPLVFVIGDASGKLYELLASNGTLLYSTSDPAAIVGVAAVRGVIVFGTAAGLIGSVRTYDPDYSAWQFATHEPLASAPVIVDGAIYAGAGDGHLYAFTSYGQPPQ